MSLAVFENRVSQSANKQIRELLHLASHLCLEIRQQRARPVCDALRAWMTEQRARVSERSAIAKALDYGLQ